MTAHDDTLDRELQPLQKGRDSAWGNGKDGGRISNSNGKDAGRLSSSASRGKDGSQASRSCAEALANAISTVRSLQVIQHSPECGIVDTIRIRTTCERLHTCLQTCMVCMNRAAKTVSATATARTGGDSVTVRHAARMTLSRAAAAHRRSLTRYLRCASY